MKIFKLAVIAMAITVFAVSISFRNKVEGQNRDEAAVERVRREKFRHNGVVESEAAPSVSDVGSSATEAPTGFDNLTNGYLDQGPVFETLDDETVVALRSFNDNRFIFEEFETAGEGLGPTYNAQSCRECHQNVVTGGGSQITEQRTGRTSHGAFFESMGGSLIHSRATYPNLVELVADQDTTRTFRMSPSTLGDGFIEAVANSTLLSIRDHQPFGMRGNAVIVPVFEGNGDGRIGRFGWKSQHASLLSFSFDAYLNEMGITTPTLSEENTASGIFVGFGSAYDPVAEPEDDGIDPIAFADFMRATKGPSRGPISSDAIAGERLFNQVSCSVCHVASMTTAPTGSVINGGSFPVPPALANKTIHPFSDFLLHDIGTGDGIPIQSTPEYANTANQMRTAPLWGLRTRSRLMHDGLTFTLTDAILRHSGQAYQSSHDFSRLSNRQKAQLIAFLKSL